MKNFEVTESVLRSSTDLLMFYINNANIESAYALIKEGEVNLDMPNNIGMTPLHQAVKVNNLSIVNMLLEFGADPNTRTEYSMGYLTPLLIACDNNYFEVAKVLLEYGADPTASNNLGVPCLHFTCRQGFLELSLLLIAHGCDANIRDGFGNNASYWAHRNNQMHILPFLPPPATVTPLENKEYRDQVEEKFLLITAEEKKKMMKKGNKK